MRHLSPSPWALAFWFGRAAEGCRHARAFVLADLFDRDAARALRRALRTKSADCVHLGNVDGVSVWRAKDGSGHLAQQIDTGWLLSAGEAADLAARLDLIEKAGRAA